MMSTLKIIAAVILSTIALTHSAEPPQISVVKTWKELAGQPAIALKGGGTARLGIEALGTPLNGGVILYCLTDSAVIDPMTNKGSEEMVGPFWIKVETHGQHKLENRVQQAHRVGKDTITQALYLQLISMPDRRGRTVTVLDKTNTPVAAAAIACTEEKYQPWAGFGDDRLATLPVEELQRDDGKPQVIEANVIAAIDAPQLPALDGCQPVLFILRGGQRGPVDFKDDMALPALLPLKYESNAVDALKFTIQLNQLKLSISTPLHFNRSYFHDNFIARWWVNDKPVEKFEESGGVMRNGGGMVILYRRANLNLKFSPEKIGAKKGDKIGLQVLFCPDGAQGTMEKMSMAHDDDADAKPRVLRFPMVSNKIEFVAE